MKILNELRERKSRGLKSFAVLIDPEKVAEPQELQRLVNLSIENKVDFFFVGGSLMTQDNIGLLIRFLKENSDIPVVLFPGNSMQVELSADAILFLSLISGRNPEYLIGQHVLSAPIIKKSNLQVLPTGYILVDSGKPTSVSYMSNSQPIPHDKPTVAACTAMAGEMLGLQLMYLDAGSGARRAVPVKMVSMVKKSVSCPIIVGGGLRSSLEVMHVLNAGADLIVIGNGIEKDLNLLIEVSERINDYNQALNIHE